MRDASPARPPPPRVAEQSWTPPAPRPPPSPDPALVLRGPPPPAAMGSEMEPLLLAWSYFRRRKFQLCADLCTQMLEKSPYDQVPAGPVSLVDSGDMTEGSGGCPGPREGSREEGPG